METVVKISAVEDFVRLYFSIGFTNKEILNLLAHQHQDFKKNVEETASFSEKEPVGLGERYCCFSGGGRGWKWSTAGLSVDASTGDSEGLCRCPVSDTMFIIQMLLSRIELNSLRNLGKWS